MLTTITITVQFEIYITIATLNLTPGPSTNPGSNTHELLCLIFRQKGAFDKFMLKKSKKSNSKLEAKNLVETFVIGKINGKKSFRSSRISYM